VYVPAGASDEPDPGGTEANACQTHNRHVPEPDRLTDAGKELQPILPALKEWGDRHCNPGAEPVVFQHTPHRLRRLPSAPPRRRSDRDRRHPPRPSNHVTLYRHGPGLFGQFQEEEHLGQDHRLDLCRVDAFVGGVDAGLGGVFGAPEDELGVRGHPLQGRMLYTSRARWVRSAWSRRRMPSSSRGLAVTK
jgi:hypothetical protein